MGISAYQAAMAWRHGAYRCSVASSKARSIKWRDMASVMYQSESESDAEKTSKRYQ